MADFNKEQEELFRIIYKIATDLVHAGHVAEWDFKSYVLGTMFYRYISENFAAYINACEHEAGNAKFDYAKISDAKAKKIRARRWTSNRSTPKSTASLRTRKNYALKSTRSLLRSRGEKMNNEFQFLMYHAEDENVSVNAVIKDETIWLTQKAMAELFDCSLENVIMHLTNIYKDEELSVEATTKDFLVVRQEGCRQVKRTIKHHNPDAIIAVCLC